MLPGVSFASGHVLALRCFPASSIGPGYTSLWHRDPDGRWTFYATVPPAQSCARYFGRDIPPPMSALPPAYRLDHFWQLLFTREAAS